VIIIPWLVPWTWFPNASKASTENANLSPGKTVAGIESK
jgi:hypothetical protein